MSQTQSRIASNSPPPIEDFGDPIGRNSQLPGKFRCAHAQRAEFFSQMFSGMNCNPRHGILLMVIDNLHIRGTRGAFPPLETNPPLVVDANAVLTFAVSLEHFKTIPRQSGEISQRNRRLETVQL